jgi:hypothetical protein
MCPQGSRFVLNTVLKSTLLTCLFKLGGTVPRSPFVAWLANGNLHWFIWLFNPSAVLSAGWTVNRLPYIRRTYCDANDLGKIRRHSVGCVRSQSIYKSTKMPTACSPFAASTPVSIYQSSAVAPLSWLIKKVILRFSSHWLQNNVKCGLINTWVVAASHPSCHLKTIRAIHKIKGANVNIIHNMISWWANANLYQWITYSCLDNNVFDDEENVNADVTTMNFPAKTGT